MARRKQQRRGDSEETAPSRQIQITAKRVTGDDGEKFDRDRRLSVPDEVSHETADLLVEKGLAIWMDGKLEAELNVERGEAQARNQQVLQKQRAETEMARHDRMSEEDRLAAHDANPEEGADIEDE